MLIFFLFVRLLAFCLFNQTWDLRFAIGFWAYKYFSKKKSTWANCLTNIMHSFIRSKQPGQWPCLFLVHSRLSLWLYLKHSRKWVDTGLSLGAPMVLSTYAGPSKVTGGRMQLERPPALPAKPHCWQERPSLWKAELKKIHLKSVNTRNCSQK